MSTEEPADNADDIGTVDGVIQVTVTLPLLPSSYRMAIEAIKRIKERNRHQAHVCCSRVTHNPQEDATYARIEADIDAGEP